MTLDAKFEDLDIKIEISLPLAFHVTDKELVDFKLVYEQKDLDARNPKGQGKGRGKAQPNKGRGKDKSSYGQKSESKNKDGQKSETKDGTGRGRGRGRGMNEYSH